MSTPRGGRRRRRLVAGAGIGAAAIAVAVAIVAASGGNGGSSQAASNSTATAAIKRQDLVETASADGTLGYDDSRNTVNRLAGTVTWLPSAGTVVSTDGVLYRVDGKPVVLLDGAVPAYRALGSGTSDGADVGQLERGLRALGYDPSGAMAVDGSWDSGTTAAVKRWQDAHGLSATGSIDLGRVIFQPGARRVSKINATLGSSGGGSGNPSGASASAGTAQTQFASYTPATTPTTPDPAAQRDAAKLKAAEKRAKHETALRKTAERKAAQLEAQQRNAAASSGGGSGGGSGSGSGSSPGSGGSGASNSAGSGSSSTTSTPVMTTTATSYVATVALDTGKATLAKPGGHVTVTLPSGDATAGTIARVGKVASKASGSNSDQSSSATVKVIVRLPAKTKGLDQAPVSVDFEQSRRRGVLAIPVTGLLAQAGGKYAVEVRDAGGRRLVPVEPGLYAGGYVEITGRGLRPGLKVTDARI